MPGCQKDGLGVAGGLQDGWEACGVPPLAQSTFDNMGAEASALRESLVNSKLFKRRKIFTSDKMKT